MSELATTVNRCLGTFVVSECEAHLCESRKVCRGVWGRAYTLRNDNCFLVMLGGSVWVSLGERAQPQSASSAHD